MKREKIKNIILIIVVAVISSTITSFATSNYLYDSIDVKYDNSNGVQAETVQGAIDELYSCASDYSGIDTRLSNVEDHFNNTTSYFAGNSLIIGDNSSSGERVIHLFDSNRTIRSTFGLTTSGETIINARNSSGQSTKGTLSLYGNPVQINGVDIQNDNLSSGFTSITLPYTAPRSGFVCVYINPKTTDGGLAIINFNNSDFKIRMNSSNGEGMSSCYPIAKGESLSLNINNNVGLATYFKSFK